MVAEGYHICSNKRPGRLFFKRLRSWGVYLGGAFIQRGRLLACLN